MSLALPTPDFEPSELSLARHLAAFRSQQIEAATTVREPHPGEDETDPASGHPKLDPRQLSLVFGERR
ncbi:hypothetical protein WKW77_00450 [Variovorax ureilyticus]|uniref:Uncharacterized protein n=1 Tax=Variovorax ureilyticus TaxID=1836198 RepID=A0ABU8V7I4_9BURK